MEARPGLSRAFPFFGRKKKEKGGAFELFSCLVKRECALSRSTVHPRKHTQAAQLRLAAAAMVVELSGDDKEATNAAADALSSVQPQYRLRIPLAFESGSRQVVRGFDADGECL